MQYTDDELCDCLRQLEDKLGETPTASQCNTADITPSAQTYCRRFGSWNTAVEAAGLLVNQEGTASHTDEELCDCLRQLAEKRGEVPSLSQCTHADITPSGQTYHTRFGSWNTALEAAGLSINEKSYTDDELIAILCEFADTLGETPTMRQLNHEPELPSARVYKDRFGSWNTALEAAGLDINQERSFTDVELLTVLQEFATELGHTPSIPEIETREDPPSATTYELRFGSWNAALRAAGLTPNQETEQYDKTDEELLEMLRELDAEMDTSPTKEDVNFVPDLPSAGVFQLRFGGWNAAKQQAGLSTHDHPNWYTDRELLQELQRVAHELGETPTTADMNNADAPSLTTYQRRFGSWSAAKEQAGLETPQQTPTQ